MENNVTSPKARENATRWLSLFTFAFLLLPYPSANAVDADNVVAWARENIVAGKYADAVSELEKALPSKSAGSAERREITLVLIEALRVLGKTVRSKELCEDLLKADAKDAVAQLTRAEIDLEAGNYKESMEDFDKFIEEHPDHDRAWALRTMAYRFLNNTEGLKKTSDRFFDLNQKKAEYYTSNDLKDPIELAYIGLGVQDENPKAAFEDGFMAARQRMEERHLNEPEILLWAAQLAQKLYYFNFAADNYAHLLKMRPKLPDALCGMAEIEMQTRHNAEGAEKLLKDALSVNPDHPASNLLYGLIELEEDRYEESKKHIDAALHANPNYSRALALLTFWHIVMNEQDKVPELEKRAKEINPKCADYYCDVGEFMEDKLRFDASPDYYQKALDIDPENWRGYYGMGMSLCRRGADSCERGKEMLLKAFKKDRFNVWASNMIKAMDKIIGDKEQNVAPQYYESKTTHFTLRYFGKEASVIRPYVEEWAEKAYERQTKLFGFEPEGPLSIEVLSFQDQSARTVGLPNLGALGVCFGKLCTVVSPKEGMEGGTFPPFNWHKVLEHEFGHVMALQLSKFRVPRWYTEAFSTYLEDDSRIESDQMMIDYIARNKLKKIDTMNEYFRENILMAYVHGRYIVEYIAKNFGFEAHVKAMKMFAEGKKLAEVLPAVTGKSLDELNKGQLEFTNDFFKTVRRRPSYDQAMLVQLEMAAKPDDAPAQAIADLAIAMAAARKFQRAEQLCNRALEKDPKCVDAINMLGFMAYEKKDYETAKKKYKESTGIDPARSFLAWQRLGIMYKKEGHTTLAINAFEAARKSFPRYVGPDNPHYELPDLYADLEPAQLDKALQVWRDAIKVNTQDPEACFKGLELAVKMKDPQAVIDFATAHIMVDPYKADVHKYAGQAYEQLKDLPHAEREYGVATTVDDKNVDCWVGLARVRKAQGHKHDALKAAKAALDVDGTNAEAKSMCEELKGEE
jgi:tetratricopeptide (TPR) repeat protein